MFCLPKVMFIRDMRDNSACCFSWVIVTIGFRLSLFIELTFFQFPPSQKFSSPLVCLPTPTTEAHYVIGSSFDALSTRDWHVPLPIPCLFDAHFAPVRFRLGPLRKGGGRGHGNGADKDSLSCLQAMNFVNYFAKER